MQIRGFFERHATRVQALFSGLATTAVIYPAAFLVTLGEGTLNLGLIFLMRDSYGATPSLVGWLMSFGTLVYVVGCLFVRPRFSKLGPRHLMLLATGGMVVSVAMLYLLRSVAFAFLFFGLTRLAASFFWPPAMGWLSQDREGKALNRVLSRFNLSWSFGLLISPTVSGLLSERNPTLPALGSVFMLSSAFLLIGGAALAVPAARRGPAAGAGGEPTAHEARDRSTPLRFTAWIGLLAGYAASAVIVTVMPQYARDALGVSKTLVGNLVSLHMLARAVGFLALGAMSFWHHRGRYQLAVSAYLAVVAAAMILARSIPALAAGAVLVALGNAFTYTGSLFHGVAGSTHRAARTAIHEALLAGGYIVGASAGGLLYQHASFQAALLFCAVLLLAALAAQAAILKRKRRELTVPSTRPYHGGRHDRQQRTDHHRRRGPDPVGGARRRPSGGTAEAG